MQNTTRPQERSGLYQGRSYLYRQDWKALPPSSSQQQEAAPRPGPGAMALNTKLGQILAEAQQANLVQYPRLANT